MSEQRASKAETITPDIGSVSPDYDSNPDLEKREEFQRPARTHREEGEGGEFVIVDEGVHLSADQRRVAHELHRLYQSLCGDQPGQYWPQALLDSAGKFNRPVYPRRGRR